MFNINEIKEWEEQIDNNKIMKHHGHEKEYFDPRKDALIRHRHRFPWRRFKESTYARKKVQRSFKAKMNTLMHHQKYHNPTPHEYKTYGWETW